MASFTLSPSDEDVSMIQGGVSNLASPFTALNKSSPLIPGMFQSHTTILIFTFLIINIASSPPGASKTWVNPASRRMALVSVRIEAASSTIRIFFCSNSCDISILVPNYTYYEHCST